MAAPRTLAQASPPVYSILDLGILPGKTISVAWSLNDLGDVTGWSAIAENTTIRTGFVWHNGVMTSIGTLPKKNYSVGLAINSFQQVVGTTDAGDTPSSLGVLYRNNALLAFDPSSFNLQPVFLSDAGVIVGNYQKGISSATPIPAIWTEEPSKPGRFRRLDLTTFTNETAFVEAANQSLIVVGYTQGRAFGTRGAFWNNDPQHTVSALNPLPGEQSVAFGVNALGTVVGMSWFGIYHSEPIVWSADSSHTPTALPLLPGDMQGWARGINNQGQVIGYSGQAIGSSAAVGNTPVTWVNGQVIAVQALLDASGAGWQILDVTAINNQGQIVGDGMHNGVKSAFLMTLQAP
jgi:probable HAF family extracellular repeat protein